MTSVVYDLAAKFSFETAGVAVGVAGLVKAFTGLERQVLVAEAAVKRLDTQMAMNGMSKAERQAYQYAQALDTQTAAQQKLNAATGAFQKMLVGGVMVTAGLGVFGQLKQAADLASTLTQTMTQVQIATNATPQQMAALQKLAVQQGTRTQFSLNEEASILAALTKARIDNVGTLTAMLPSVTNFAEVMKMSRGVAPEQSATIAAQFSHLFGQYQTMGGKNGPGMEFMTNLLGRALAVTPTSPDEALRLVSQFAGQMRPLYGQTAAGRKAFVNDAISTMVLEAQLGQESRGGTQFASLISRTLGSGRGGLTSAQNNALAQISALAGGRQFFNKQGTFGGISNALSILELAAAHKGETPQQIGTLFKNAFGMVGNRQAGILADKVTVQQLAQIGKLLDPKTGLISLDKIRQAYNQTPQGQQARAVANIQTFETEMGQTFIPLMNMALGPVANLTAGLANLAADHPVLTQLASGAMAVGAGFLTVAGAVKLFKGAWEILNIAGMAKQMKTVAVALKGLAGGEALAGVAGSIRLVAGAYLAAAGAAAKFVASQIAAGAAGAATWVAGAASSLKVLAAGYLTTTLAVARLTAGQIATGVSSLAMAAGEGVATAASIALDLALSPIVLTVGAVAAGVASSVWVWQNWATVLGAIHGKFGPIVQGVALAALTFAPFLGAVEAVAVAFHHWNDIMKTVQDTWTNLSRTVHQAPHTVAQLAGQAGSGILGGLEHILLPGALQGLFGIGGGGLATGTGGGGLPAGAHLPARAGARVVHTHQHQHAAPRFAPGSIVINGTNKEPRQMAEEIYTHLRDLLAKEWGNDARWQSLEPIGLQAGSFGF